MERYFKSGGIFLILVCILMIGVSVVLVYGAFTVGNLILAMIMVFGSVLLVGTALFSLYVGMMFLREAKGKNDENV